MERMRAVDKIKIERAQIRGAITRRIQNSITTAADGGHFPAFEDIVKEVTSEISSIMESSTLTLLEWSIILQEKEPDRFCKKTMELLESTCPEE